MKKLQEIDYLVLQALSKKDKQYPVLDLAEEIKCDQAKVTAVCLGMPEEIQVEEQEIHEFKLGSKGKEYAQKDLPERTVIETLAKHGEALEMPEIAAKAGIEPKEVGQSLRWLNQKKWAKKEGKQVVLLDKGKKALEEKGADEQLVAILGQKGPLLEQQVQQEVDLPNALSLLKGRTGFVDQKTKKKRLACLTQEGKQLVAEGIETYKEVNQITSEMLVSGEWRNVQLRPYDVKRDTDATYPGKTHPMVSLFQKTRRVFFEMGFSEIKSPYVESSFWDFDALFQPQDHPARDMQDTFYIGRPKRSKLPENSIVEQVKNTHQDGGDTGSVGWRYKWNKQLAEKPVLRTHTTASTIRALAENPNPPRKVFCIGPVFRRETVDYKHLPVFHQVDGIIIDEKASLASLLGTLEAFYKKMGFSKFQFRPAFFPYTEPSVEIFVWLESKNDWVEMGGSGIFRPEVTKPFGCNVPVIAWGLGLERVAMFQYNLKNISDLYRCQLPWLKETPLCR